MRIVSCLNIVWGKVCKCAFVHSNQWNNSVSWCPYSGGHFSFRKLCGLWECVYFVILTVKWVWYRKERANTVEFESGDLCLLYVYECFVYMYGSALCTCSAHGDQERAVDLLRLVLLMVMSCCVGAGNQIWSSARATNAFNRWAICSPVKAEIYSLLTRILWTALVKQSGAVGVLINFLMICWKFFLWLLSSSTRHWK